MTFLQSELTNNVLLLTINRPKANALNLELILELQNAFKQAARDSQTRVVILTGAGRVFSAGQDIDEFQAGGDELSLREHLLKTYNPLVLQIRQLEKPVIAAINGPVAGASLGVALACDLRIASDQARFVVGFNGIGLVPDSGVSLLLPALIGLGRALEYTFTNQPITAEQALAWGLINQLVPAGKNLEAAQTTAARLANGPVGAFGLTKRAYNHAVLPNLPEVLEYESYLQEIAGHRAEHKQAVTAFLAKKTK